MQGLKAFLDPGSIDSSYINFSLSSSAMVSRAKSSEVGPNPPVVMTRSDLFHASAKKSLMSSAWSRITRLAAGSIP